MLDTTVSEINLGLKAKKRGAKIKKRNLVFSLWPSMLYGKNKKISWETAVKLYEWFQKKLCVCKYYDQLNIRNEVVDKEEIKTQYHRHAKHKVHMVDELCYRFYTGDRIVIFGKNEIHYYSKGYLLDPEIKKLRLDKHAKLAARLERKNPRFSSLIIFPDNSYLIE